MATEVAVRLRTGEPIRLSFDDEEDWQLKDDERLVYLLGGDKVIRAVVNLTDFVCAVATPGGEDDG